MSRELCICMSEDILEGISRRLGKDAPKTEEEWKGLVESALIDMFDLPLEGGNL